MHRFSSAHAIAAVALFVALTGTAIAVEKDSVGTKQLKDHAVKESKLGDHAVTEAKIADDAVTGAKVNESTLGQVPSAASADSATKADTATNAIHANSATNATNATNATTAATATSATTAQTAATATSAGSATTATTANIALNAALFAEHDLQGVRPLATGVSVPTDQALDPVAYVEVMTVPVDVLGAGADLIVNASFTLANHAGAARQAQCNLIDDAGNIDAGTTISLFTGASASGSVTAFVNNVSATPAGNPQDVRLRCQGSGANGDVHFNVGDLNVLRVPIG